MGPGVRRDDDAETHVSAIPRHNASELLQESFRPTEGVGNAGCPMHPQPRVRILVVSMHTSIHSGRTGNHPASPHAMVLTVSFALSLVTGLDCHHRLRKDFHKLDASVGASGPHDFAVRLGAVRQRHRHVHRIPPRVRDDRDTPLEWDKTAAESEVIWVFGKSEYFCKRGWTANPNQWAKEIGSPEHPSMRTLAKFAPRDRARCA